MKRLIQLTMALLILALASGCREEKKYKIGVSQCSTDDWRTKLNGEIGREAMYHDNIEVEIRSADDDSRKQIEDIRYFKDNGFDIVIVSPNEAETLTPFIKEIYEGGMPVIIFDRNINDTTYTARIGADDLSIGKSAATYTAHMLGNRVKAFEIYGLRGSTPAEDRHKGFVDQFVKNGGELLASVEANWNQEDAERVTDSLLRIYPDVQLIYAHNDRMAIGASNVARSLGRNDIKIIGIDAAPNIGIKAVSDGVIDATFLYPTEGQRLIETAMKILDGQPFEKVQMIPSYSAVDKTNADILLMQNRTIDSETSKMVQLKKRIDSYWTQHSLQTTLLYSSIGTLTLLFILCFVLLRMYWARRRHQETLQEQNRLLEEERDKQKLLNDKLEEATQSKLMFFTNVSHDLRTPLSLISEPVSELSKAANLTERQRTLTRIADKNIRILQRLINQILDFRKYENGKLKLHMETGDLSKEVREWSESFKTLALKRHIRFSFDCADGDYVTSYDHEKIERVFFNIVSNAFKYTPDNGNIDVSIRKEGDEIVFTVVDTGEGISERDLGNIFDRFFQVDRVHPNGSGIGLSLAKAFVELHGGHITAESKLNEGSVFTFTLPVVKEGADDAQGRGTAPVITGESIEAELNPIESDVQMEEGKPLLLLIDDNKDIQKLVGELLGDEYNVLAANNGREGLRLATKYVPDLIICDVMMPVMDGLECTRRLKEEVTTSHIPVLMLTACSLDEQRVQGYESGADGYISKPFNTVVLRSRITNLLENRRRIKQLWEGKGFMQQPEVSQESRPLPVSGIDNDFYNKFLEILNKEIGNADISVDGIAAKLGLGRSQFYRKIKALTNYSPVELIKRIRLEKARSMLLTTDKTVSEIGYDTGFSTPAYFTKCYREAYGKTPTDERKDLR